MTSSEPEGASSVALDDLALFTFMSPEVRHLVEAALEPVSYPYGTAVVREGEPSDALYVVISGRARAVKGAEGGREVSLDVLGPGDSFGEMGLLTGAPRAATVRASEPVEALRLDGVVFRALVASDPRVRESFELSMRYRSLGNLIRLSSAFADLPNEAMVDLLRALEPVHAAAGDIVVCQGDEAGELYIVDYGRLRAFRDEDGARQDLAYLRKGDVFGERALFTGTDRYATVEALSDSRLLRLDGHQFQRLLDDHDSLRRQVSDLVAQYDYRRLARVPLDFAEEVLPAEAARPEPVADDQLDEELETAPATEAAGPFVTGDGLFAKNTKRVRRFPVVRQVDAADCGAAALAMVCRHFEAPASLARVRQLVNTGIDGTSLKGIARGAEQVGLAARALKVSRRNLPQMPLPAIIHWGGNHWVVLYDVGESHVRIADPALGLRRLPRGELDEKWSGYAVLFAPTDRLVRTQGGGSGYAWLRPIAVRYWRPIAGASVLALLVSGLELVVPVFTQVVVDRVLGPHDLHLLHVLIAAMGVVLVVTVAASFLQRYVLSRAAVGMDGETLDFVAVKMLALPMTYFYARRTGDIQRRLVGMRQVRQFLVLNGVGAITALAQLAVAVVLMLVYSRLLALVFLAAVPLYVGLMRFAVKRIRPLVDNLEESFGRYHSLQVDAIKGIETVKALGAEDSLRRSMVREYAGLSDRQFRADLAGMCYQGAVQALTFASLAAFLWVGSLQVLNGSLTVGGLVAFSGLVALAGAPIALLLALWDELQTASVLLNRLDDIFEEEPEQGDDHSHLRPVPTIEGRVRLEGVAFRYGGPESPAILSGVSLDVAPGTAVAIVGRSGSGKTTLVKCLAGLIEPTEGSIHYDAVDMRALDYRQLRRQIGFVLQENFLFADTLAANIAFGEEEPDIERVRWAAGVANAHEFISRLPLGYHTKVGETGLLLSGGQRQRVAIARAVYHSPPVLILDEATSALDTESERAVQENMGRLLESRTSFVIAHRLSTIRNADVILVLEKGRLVEHGNHDELLANRGLYYYLYSQQLQL